MPNSTDQPSNQGGAQRSGQNWPLMRKVEALIFFAMFLAVPFFAMRVLNYTHSQLVVRTVYRDLAHDLARAKAMAIDRKTNIDVIGERSALAKSFFSYSIKAPEGAIEEIVLPQDISVVGTVTFTESGQPVQPASFFVSSFSRNATVEIDRAGIVSVP